MSTTTEQGYLTLVVHGEDRPVALACDKCGRVHALKDADLAAQCCQPYRCTRCGEEVRRHEAICNDCWRKDVLEKEEARFRAATVVPWDEAAGAVLYDEEHDRWISAPEDAEEGDPPTRYAYATLPLALSIDSDDVIENALASGDHHEDAGDEISHEMRVELRDFLADWCRRTGVVSRFPDYSRVVVFDAAPQGATQEGEGQPAADRCESHPDRIAAGLSIDEVPLCAECGEGLERTARTAAGATQEGEG